MKNKIVTGVSLFLLLYISISFNSGCAQIGMPTGGVKDTLAPVLTRATPVVKALNFTGNKITLVFDEYVTVQEAQANVLVSPLPKNNPNISNSLKTVTIKLRDTLMANTTYSIQFGDAIRDINESNILKNFSYVFSTGNIIDSLSLSGKILLAETGGADSTISAVLYKNISDTAVRKLRPDYMAKVKGDGSFTFNNLAEGVYKLYALKDGDGGKTYNVKTELFGFLDTTVAVSSESPEPTLFAYAEEKPKENQTIRVLKPAFEKRLKYSTNLSGTQDLLDSFKITFNNPLKLIDSSKLLLTDTNHNSIGGAAMLTDSTKKILTFVTKWSPGSMYQIILPKDALEDSAGNKLVKADTLKFAAKANEDYGRITLRFKNYVQDNHPVLQLFLNQVLKYSFPLTSLEFSNKFILPGEYEIRILYDTNNDGVWTPGNYSKRLQPEKAFTLPQKLAIRADWDNERDIIL